jgi:hypothetical protein
MFADNGAHASTSPHARSAISNGKRLHEGVDGRSTSARRFRDLVNDLTAELLVGLPAGTKLSTPDRSAIRQAATIVLQAEQLQAAIVRGETVDPDVLIRLSGEARRMLAAVRGMGTPPGTAHIPLRERLAAEAGEAA